LGLWDKSELDKVVDAAGGRAAPAQPALFAPAGEVAAAPAPRRVGRPPGSRNLRSERYAAILRAELGDPLRAATRIAAIDILAADNLGALARAWGCSRYEAARLWAQINRDVMPYHHQQLPRAVILPPGAPGGERVLVELDGEVAEIGPGGDGTDEAADEAA
jgi:hypothetical protein